jgi:hypothetical protein
MRHRNILLAGVICAMTIAACGGSGSTPTGQGTTATGDSSPFALSKCMRTHGVSNFPDPSAGPGGEGFHGVNSTPGSDALTVDGITFSGPAFQAAEKACKKLLPGGGGPPPPVSAAQRQAAIANARCMRRHGVPNFPDPTFPAGGGIAIRIGAGVNPQSPAFTHAQAACGTR